MLQKIRDLARAKEELDALSSQQKQIAENTKLLQETITGLQEDIRQLHTTHQEFSKQFQNQMERMDDLMRKHHSVGADFEKEVQNIHVLKNDMQKRMLEHTSQQVKELLKEFHSKTAPLKDIDTKARDILAQLEATKVELQKFNSISKLINEKDFELVKFGQMLERNDREKVELLKKIDALERLMAAMQRNKGERRGQRQRY